MQLWKFWHLVIEVYTFGFSRFVAIQVDKNYLEIKKE